jgi:UDP-N-acetylglucosamine 2-epimerase (non-hydrolysing)
MPTRVLTVFGTRPEAIKMVPVIHALSDRGARVHNRICVTAQHRGMLDQMLELFRIRADYDLNIMTTGQSPMEVVARVMDGLEPILQIEDPDWVLVQGDTTTTMATALAASISGIRVGHIEAGLRTFDKKQPFPEEINRMVTTSIADLHFAPTYGARSNLLNERVEESRIIVTGNPVIDALFTTLTQLDGHLNENPLEFIGNGKRLILVTAHRRENFGNPHKEICRALIDIASLYRDSAHIVYPVHPNPIVHDMAHGMLGLEPNITLLPPLDYLTWVHVMARSTVILTDSGGVQEEAPSLGKPVLILRDITERPECVEAGLAKLVGTDRRSIVRETSRLLSDEGYYRRMAHAINLFGDGNASNRIVAALLGERVADWMPQARIAN